MVSCVPRPARRRGDAEQCVLLLVGGRRIHQYLLHDGVGHEDGLGTARPERWRKHAIAGRDCVWIQG